MTGIWLTIALTRGIDGGEDQDVAAGVGDPPRSEAFGVDIVA